MGRDSGARIGFDLRVETAAPQLPPAEARMALFFAAQKEAVVLSSAAQIAEAAGASDATVVRTARSLGYAGLSEMREDILAELTGAASPARLLSRTLDAAGEGPAAILDHVLSLHTAALGALTRPETAAAFARVLDLIAAAPMRYVFGIGPSGAIADYAALQFNRIGLRSHTLSSPGIALADRLAWLAPGDVVVMLAYAPIYREVEVVLDRASERGAKVVLISDSLGPQVGDRVVEMLAVPRGRSEHLSMHGATMVLIEALILGLAAQDRDRAIAGLDTVGRLRGRLDRDWIKRGVHRSVPAAPADAPVALRAAPKVSNPSQTSGKGRKG
ncbi:MurR/RpiR family transcriptional regulator [Acidimangrovimonas sediminis]|uniref:MurR/RpiR family transcriptional regulator n=1 Tax=Acidimangrovimonas sediminis TaxID=2056283 RepID=UPI000C7FAFC3|nr:MurR/RpiR family transcriptional regulator [Acidimangrovimonas sediminis]